MNCPCCDTELATITYEGITIETCPACQGEWLDEAELGHVVRIRQQRFSPEERQRLAAVPRLRGVKLSDVDRDLACPKCGGQTDPVNYGGDSGIIIDRCTDRCGIWLDGDELEKIQVLVESWTDALPADLRSLAPKLRQVAFAIDQKDDIELTRLPLIGRYVNMLINGIIDLID